MSDGRKPQVPARKDRHIDTRKTHWLRENAANRTPRRVICFDTEARKLVTKTGQEHTFRLASMSFDVLDRDARPIRETEYLDFGTPEALWGYISKYAETKHRTVAFAHNLSYDIRLSNGLKLLPEFGWECAAIALTAYSFWARFKKDGYSLTLQDSLSFIPASLDRIASAGQLEKDPLPRDGASDETWLRRCQSDVRVTREAIIRILQFIRADDLGDFRLTGAAQSSAAFRHRFMRPKSLLVHADADALHAEREACFTGRTEVFRHGEIAETVYEYDYEFAYTRLAYDLDVPTRLIARHSPLKGDRLERIMSEYAVLARCTVRTDMPLVPTRYNGGIVWPIGEFESYLWDHEMRLLSDNDATYSVSEFWFYKREPLLRPWAEWMMEKLNAPAGELDPIARIMLKDWSRALIGRFGLRYSKMDEIATLVDSDVASFGVWDSDEQAQMQWLHLGHKLFDTSERIESPNSTPMIMSAIMSAARVRLWRAMQVATFEHILYCDTDGFLTNNAGAKRIDAAIVRGSLPGLKRKGQYHANTIRSPRNLDIGETRRVSGAPKKAERLAPGIYRGEVWESLPAALNRRKLGRVFTHERTFNISDHDPRRVHLPDGSTAPHRIELCDQESPLVSA